MGGGPPHLFSGHRVVPYRTSTGWIAPASPGAPTKFLTTDLLRLPRRSRKRNQSVAFNHHLIAHCAARAEQDAVLLRNELYDGDGRTHSIAGPNGGSEPQVL